MARNRMTWGAGRSASAPPAIPGYGTEDQDHPAHQDDPKYEEYKKGDPDAWAETPKAPPYPQGNPPATPGYDTEDQDHPAHENPPRVPKEAQLRVAIERKAAKCIRVARALLGSKATEAAVEDQALDMMDWSDAALNSTLTRLGGGLLAEDEEEDEEKGEKEACQADDLFALLGDMDIQDPEGVPASPVMAAIMDKLAALSAQVQKLADQNDPKGKTLAPSPKTEEQVRAEGEATTKKQEAKSAARFLFASMDTDRDGFITAADWKGSKALFAAIDTDKDGIIAMGEMLAATAEDDEDEEADKTAGLDPEEIALLAMMEAKVASKKAEDGDDDGEGDDEESEDAEDEDDLFEDEGKKAAEDEDEEESEEEPVEAGKKSCMGDDMPGFEMMDDPMGLGDTGDVMLDDDDAVLAEIFGGKAAAKKGEDEEEEGDESEGESEDEEPEMEEDEEEKEAAKKKASRTASQRPQPRKPSRGVRRIGQQTRTASVGGEELADLTRLWQSAPDVSGVFGSSKD